jgi:hypothetical protein
VLVANSLKTLGHEDHARFLTEPVDDPQASGIVKSPAVVANTLDLDWN